MNFFQKDKTTLCNILFHCARIRGSIHNRDIILQRMYREQIRGICRAHEFYEEKILSGLEELPAGDNGAILHEKIYALVESSRK